MRILKLSKEKTGRLKELENELDLLRIENEQLRKTHSTLKSIPLSLLAEIEEIDFLIYSLTSNTFLTFLEKAFVLPKIPFDLSELKSFFHPEDLTTFENALDKSSEKSFIENQMRLVSEKDNTKETKSVEVVVFRNPAEKDQVIISIKDISQIARQRKELLKSREKIEESDKLKSSILFNISHQIRTPLNSITGFSELLAGSDSDIKKRKEYIEIIKQQSKRILGLIDDISEIAKLETGKINLSKIPCNLKLILKEILIGLNQQRTAKQQEQVEIKLNIPEGSGIELMTDSGRLQQTLINIINYSLRYTQKGFIEFGYQFDEPSSKVVFFVNDTSSGLTKDEQKVIFNKFSVIDLGESTKMEDPGLGLTIAKNIVKNLNGKIWVESEEGKGNSFLFTIPFEPVPSTEHVDIENEINLDVTFQWPNKRILIVDDEEVNAMFLDAVFQGSGVQILFAKNGHEAVELSKNISGIDLILMDLKMPVMNGLKATQEIRKFNTKLPIIAQTALASEEDQQQCILVGCNATITKPIEVQELMVLVNKYLCD
jgi:signal transduction histidine kinase